MNAKRMRKIFEENMEDFGKTEDKAMLCRVSSTFALFAILDELQKLRKERKSKKIE